MDNFLNCAFTALALPLGLFLLVYGIILLVNGRADHGVFLIVLAVLLLGAVASGYVSGVRRRAKNKVIAGKSGKGR